jgi:RNA polymerase sigma factor (sigma-70 family)
VLRLRQQPFVDHCDVTAVVDPVKFSSFGCHDRRVAGQKAGMGASASEQFQSLYAAHLGAILSYAVRRVPAPEDAADVAAETFMVAWRRCAEIPPGEPALLWLYGVARRVLANHLRGEGRRTRLGERLRTELADQVIVPDPADEVVEIRTVRAALARLERADREVLELTVWEHLAPREIAVALELSPETVRARLSRARGRLREQLQDGGHDPGVAGHLQSVRPALVPKEEM